MLGKVFPEYSSLFSKLYGVTPKELLLKYPLLEDMLAISAEEVGNLLCKCSKGYVGINEAKEIGTVTGVVAMKMTNIIFTVLRNQEIYVPNI